MIDTIKRWLNPADADGWLSWDRFPPSDLLNDPDRIEIRQGGGVVRVDRNYLPHRWNTKGAHWRPIS